MTRHPGQSETGSDSTPSDDESSPRVMVMSSPGRQTVWWVMTLVLAVIATALVMRWDDGLLNRSALAQLGGIGGGPQAGAGARGIYAFSGQLTGKTYGVFMLDVDTGTIWCYELSRGGNNELQMRLVAARSWVFDRYLEEFNAANPIPAAVKAMVQRQRSHRDDQGAGAVDTEAPNGSTRPGSDGSN